MVCRTVYIVQAAYVTQGFAPRAHAALQEPLQYIQRLIRQGLPPTQSIIQRFASEIAKKELVYTRLIALSRITR
jgi:hypothetical protein